MDFTLKIYIKLLQSFQFKGYQFTTFEQYCTDTPIHRDANRQIILRHDVDEYAANALKMAEIEHNLGIKATYYFRKVKQSDNPEIIIKIAAMGHEVGYHYETLSVHSGDMDKAVDEFRTNLEYFRTYYPVKTVCMHGSSTSKHDNRDIWQNCTLEEFGLIGEPYISIDFDKVFYLTDTGYAWDGGKYAVRDIVENKFGITFHSTQDIISSIEKGSFPNQAMILAHTLWTDKPLLWVYLFLRENIRIRVKLLSKNSKFVAKLYSALTKLYWRIK